jgi:hypothetical protein
MAEADIDRERRARDLRGEEERRAIALAEKRAQDAAKVESHLAEHDRRLEAINGSINKTAGELHGLNRQVNDLSAEFRQSLAVAAARAGDAERAAKRQVSSREFFLGLAGLALLLTGLLVSHL